MKFKQAFFPSGLLLATAVSLIAPRYGVFLKEAHAIPIMVCMIFLINGWQFKFAGAKINRSFVVALLLMCGLSLVGGPFIGVAMARLFSLDATMALGLVVIATVPVTLSSATVLTEISGGNRAWALLMTVGLNLVGIISVPYLLALTLNDVAAVHLAPSSLFLKLLLLVLAPFLIGAATRKLLRSSRSPAALSYVPSVCVILTVYAGFSTARPLLLELPGSAYPAIVGASLSVHFVLMTLGLLVSLILGLAHPERNTLLFISSQKTLPIALSIITLISSAQASALIPCLIFHFGQLLFDSFLASALHGHRQENPVGSSK